MADEIFELLDEWKAELHISQPALPSEPEKTLADRIDEKVQALLSATLAGDLSAIDANNAELYRLGVSRDRAQERVLHQWAEANGYRLNGKATNTHQQGRVMGQAQGGKGLRQQIPGFGLDRDLHLLCADGGGGKTTAACELATIYTARCGGFLDHEAPRTDPEDDPRDTVLIIASDGEGSAFDMWDDYFCKLNAYERGLKVEIWAQDDATGEEAWNVGLPNLHRLAKRLEKGDVVAVFADTANSILRGAGIDAGVGPVETYLRLLKKIVCRHAALWLLHHTNRSGQGLKAIGGHPAFQEVPSVIHMIQTKEGSDGESIRLWHVLKLRGQSPRHFSYALKDGRLQVVEGHFFENCSDEVLAIIQRLNAAGQSTKPAAIQRHSERPMQSIYNALNDLRSRKLAKPKGVGYQVTPAGMERLKEISYAPPKKYRATR